MQSSSIPFNPICPGVFLSDNTPGLTRSEPPCVNPERKILLT